MRNMETLVQQLQYLANAFDSKFTKEKTFEELTEAVVALQKLFADLVGSTLLVVDDVWHPEHVKMFSTVHLPRLSK